jgi:DNA topoisomerase-1
VVKDNREGTERKFVALKLVGNQISREVKKEMTGQEKNKLFPTDIGSLVTDFLASNFPEIMDYGFTASVEKEFDEIAKGQTSWVEMIGEFYGPFHEHVDKTLNEAVRVTGERIIGKDPKTGLTMLVRMGKFGPLVQIGSREETAEPRYASLRKEQSLETISLEEALDLFKLPREVMMMDGEPVIAALGRYGPYLKHGTQYYNLPRGTDPITITAEEALALIEESKKTPKMPLELGMYEGKAVQVNKGRFGPYVRWGDLFANIPKGEDMFAVTLERATELIVAKQKTEASKIIQSFASHPDIQVLNGRYGAYIGYKKNNYLIPKDQDPATISIELILQIIEAKDKEGGTKSKAKAPAKKAPAKKVAAKKPAAVKKPGSGKK